MNRTIEPGLVNSNRLFLIDEKLSTYKSVILYQKEEILKTEAIIKQYTDHLDRQNEALKLYLEEEEELIKKKEKIIQYNESYQNEKNIIEDIQQLSEENINEVNMNETPQKINFVDDVEMMIPQAEKSNENLVKKIRNHQKDVSTINITEINNETVKSMSIYRDDIFIGGSNGMLMKYSSKETFIYETNTKESILQIEIMNNNDNISLYAFTKETVIVYKNTEEPHLYRHIDLPRINHVFKKENMLYITNKDGIIHKLNIKEDTIKVYKTNKCVSNIAIGDSTSPASLAVFKNGLLYKCNVTEDSIYNFEHVKGVQGIKGVLRINKLGYVYHSDTTIWIVDYKLNKLEIEKFENGIKFVEIYNKYLAVFDHGDTLHIYKLYRKKNSFNKCYCQGIIRGIAAMAICRYKVYLSVGNNISILKYK